MRKRKAEVAFIFIFNLRRIVFANENLYGDRPFIFFENPT